MDYVGPFVKGSEVEYPLTYDITRKDVYRSLHRPYVKPLPYDALMVHCECGPENPNMGRLASFQTQEAAWNKDETDMMNILFARSRNKMGSKAALALTLLDLPKSLLMITNRSRQLNLAFESVLYGHYRHALNHLGVTVDSSFTRKKLKLATALKSPADTWLEFTFGWVPLVQDIYSAIDVLQQDFGFTRVMVRAQQTFVDESFSEYPPGNVTQRFYNRVQAQNGYGCKVRIDNPNLFLANKLGLINPAAVAWDAIPFSFVVDWFLPVGQFLNNFTVDVGLSIEDEFVTRRRWVDLIQEGQLERGKPLVLAWKGKGNLFRRRLESLPAPSLKSLARLPKFSPWLAATSVSLLTQKLASIKPKV